MMTIGVRVFGFASVAAGILDLIWGELEPAHQPLQAWGHVPGMRAIGYVAAIWLMVGGTAILWNRSRQWGAGALTLLYGIFVLFPLPRFHTAPHYLGYGASVYIGVLGSVCEQVILFVAAAIVWMSARAGSLPEKAAHATRWIFGLCSVDFGLSHLTAVWAVVPLVPKWLPFGPRFWAVLTGIAFVLAGLGIVSGVLDVAAAKLLGLMLLVFSALSLLPLIFASPHNHVAWGGNAYNLTAVGAAWIVAGWLAAQQQRSQRLRLNDTQNS